MAIRPFVRPLGIIAATLGIVQGTVWLILALLTILLHFEVWVPKLTGKTYGQRLTLSILLGYVNGEVSLGLNYDATLFIRPQEFYMWAFIYLFTSILWIGFSSFLLYVLLQKKYQWLRKTCLGWAMWVTIISITDLLLASFLASDYDTLVTAVNLKPATGRVGAEYPILACGIVMTLAAKGFVLWIVNVIFDGIVIKIFLSLPKKITEDDLKSDMFEASGERSVRHGQPGRPRSHSFTSSSFGTFHGLPRLPPIQSTNERLAQLRRSVRSRYNSTTLSRPDEAYD